MMMIMMMMMMITTIIITILKNSICTVPMVAMAQSAANWHYTHSRGSQAFTHILDRCENGS